MEPVGNAEPCHLTYRAVHHITASGHHETDIVTSFQHFCSRLDEIFRPFLERDTSEERDYLVLHSPLDIDIAPAAEIHRIMNSHDL